MSEEIGKNPDSTGSNVQEELPFAIVHGEPLSTPPTDLYIPPDALEVILDAFSGPMDLLLYLIKRQNLDILNIPIAIVTDQYIEYINMMRSMRLELAADYLVMAAMLAEIKSRMLLPRPIEEDDEDDPRAELVRRLQEYEQIKQASEKLDEIPRMHRDYQLLDVDMPPVERQKPLPEITMRELVLAFNSVLQRAEMQSSHQINREVLSVRERMSIVLNRISGTDSIVEFHSLFANSEGKMGVVVSFLAILELLKEGLIDVVQSEPLAPIYLSAVVGTQEQQHIGEEE